MKCRIWLVFIAGTLAIALWSVSSRADSHARIVRLSEIEGDIEIDRGQGFQRAVLNLPMIEGTKLRAGYDGYAEVEFEDSTTVRITPGTVVEFPRLELQSSGAKGTTVNVLEGIAYVSYFGTKGDDFLLTFDGEKVPLVKAAHIRLEMGHTKARLSVFNGDLQVESASGLVEVKKRHAVAFALNDQTPELGSLAKIQSDAWDAQLEDYHERYSKSGVYRNPGFGYGFSDLLYFGSFANLPVCGLAWRPFLASANWDPFTAGGWAWYQGSGYSWVSAYPWGWAPYHYGSWQNCPGVGWAWQPGGTWRGLDNCPDQHRHPHVLPPPHPPAEVGQPAVAQAQGLRNVPFPVRELAGPLLLRKNSAGLGVPRGAIPDMHRVSQQVERHGSAAAFVYPQQSSGGVSYVRGTGGSNSSSSSGQQGGGSRSGSGPLSTPHNSGGSSTQTAGGSSASAPRTGGGSTTTPK